MMTITAIVDKAAIQITIFAIPCVRYREPRALIRSSFEKEKSPGS